MPPLKRAVDGDISGSLASPDVSPMVQQALQEITLADGNKEPRHDGVQDAARELPPARAQDLSAQALERSFAALFASPAAVPPPIPSSY